MIAEVVGFGEVFRHMSKEEMDRAIAADLLATCNGYVVRESLDAYIAKREANKPPRPPAPSGDVSWNEAQRALGINFSQFRSLLGDRILLSGSSQQTVTRASVDYARDLFARNPHLRRSL